MDTTNKDKIKEILDNRLIIILNAFAIIIVILVPFLSSILDSKIAQIIWCISSIVYITDITLRFLLNIKSSKDRVIDYIEKVGALIIWYVLQNVFVLNYYELGNIWHYISFVIILIAIPFIFYGLFFVYYETKNIDEGDVKNLILNIFKRVVLYWCFDLLYLFYIQNWLIPTLVFGIIAVCIIFYNLAGMFINNNAKGGYILIADFMLGVILSVYLIYCIKDNIIQDIVLTVTAAIYGGLLTLIGVAWTIRHTQAQNFESNRLEKIPYLNVDFSDDVSLSNNIADLYLNITENPNNDDLSLFLNMNISNIGLGIATNTKCDFESSSGYLECWLPFNVLKVDSLETVVILFSAETKITPQIETSSFIIRFNDILGNEYEQVVKVSFEITMHKIEFIECAVLEPKLVKNYME